MASSRADIPPPFERRALSVMLASLFACTIAPGAAAETAGSAMLADVAVTATRTDVPTDSVAATVTVIDRAALDRRQPRDEADLFTDETDVSMARDERRFGATRVNIRGIEDNRVVQLVDGVPLPDYYNSGGPTNFTMNAVPGTMPDFLKQVEIVRGPASSLYGSNAIGGVVGYITLDPSDILSGDSSTGGRLKAGYTGANNGFTQTVLGAFRTEGTELLLGYSQGQNSETDNQGTVGGTLSSRTRPNPQNTDDKGVLAKLIMRPAAGHKLTATLDMREQQTDTTIMRIPSSLSKVTSMQGDDNVRRVRGSLEWEHKPAGLFYDRMAVRLFQQDSNTTNRNYQSRSNTSSSCSATSGSGNTCFVSQDFNFKQITQGAGVQMDKGFAAGGMEHWLTAGVDLMRVRVEERRNATIWNETTGTQLSALAGETYPTRDFASGVTDTVGVYIQDNITGLAGGRLSLTPGLRADWTRLRPDVDSLAQQTLTQLGRDAEQQTYSAWSPKLGAQWTFTPAVTGYAQVAAGFRAPNYSEVNGAYRNATQYYAIVPNPDLKPERSVGGELGLRLKQGTVRAQASVFDNHYRDFIEQVRLSCPGSSLCYNAASGWSTYTSVNINQVRIYGFDMRGSWEFARGWRMDGAFTYSHGTNEETGQPLNSIDPIRASASVAYGAGDWGAEGRVRAAARKTRIDESSSTYFRTPGYAVVDVSAWKKLTRDTRVTVGITNLFDRKYWLWSDIRQADSTNPSGVDFYSQPGRALNLSMQMDF